MSTRLRTQTKDKSGPETTLRVRNLKPFEISRKQEEVSEIPPIVEGALRSPGERLDPGTRALMESRLGHDFGRVRVHTDRRAAESARAVNALAYAVGENVAFGTDRYTPETIAGRELLAHELAHTIQQQTFSQPFLARRTWGEMELAAEVKAEKEGEQKAEKPAASALSPEQQILRFVIDLFASSKTAKTLIGQSVLSRLEELYGNEEMGLEEMKPGKFGEYRPGSWLERDYLALNIEEKASSKACGIVHEGVHALEMGGHPLDEELAAFTLQALFYEEIKSGSLRVPFVPSGSLETFLALRKQDKAVDFLFPAYSKYLDLPWVLKHKDDWGGISNRESETKAAFVRILMEEGETYEDLIFEIVASPSRSALEFLNMIRKIGGSGEMSDMGDEEEGIRRLKKVFADKREHLEGLQGILKRYNVRPGGR